MLRTHCCMNFDRDLLKTRLAELARQGVFIGTSSWKYPGWRGLLYDEARYVYRGKISEARFERSCLSEYAEVFKSVGVDAAYYQFPTERYLTGLVEQVPADFLFSFKVTDTITLKHFPNLPRFGRLAGQTNESFLNAELFNRAFLQPCEPFRAHIGLLMFEFTRLYPADFARGRDFVEALDRFLGALPQGWRYGVEIRNRAFLQPEYFAMLARHGVAHVFNSWDAMPSVTEQLAHPDCFPTPDFFGARFLLKPGRKYEEAVKEFSPCREVKEVNAEARAAGTQLIRQVVAAEGRRKGFIYVNNRLEGNALTTIAAMIGALV